MRISLDTNDVKRAIREFVQNRRIIQADTKIEMEIVPLRQGEEKLRVDIIIQDDLDSAMPIASLTKLRENANDTNEEPDPESAEKEESIFSFLKE